MKKIYLSLSILLSSITFCNAQIMQASVGAGTTSDAIKVFVKTSTPIGSAYGISTLQFDIAFPTSAASPVVTLTPNTANFPGITWIVDPPVIESGYKHYFITTAANVTYSKLDGSETEVFEFRLAGALANTLHLITLPDGGITTNAVFLSTSGTINSNGSNLYFNRPGTSVTNGFSYRANGTLGTFGDAISFAILSSVVPTKFTAFSATKKDNDGLLNFVVENETDITEKYEVERSLDGTTFEKINTLVAVKNGAASNVYNVVDANLANTKNNGIIYYRIKQIDADGKTAYTEIKSIRLVDKAGLSAFPNPVQDYTNVRIDVLENTEITLTLVNAEGKQIMTKTLQVQKGTNLTKLDMSPLAAGNYLIKAMVGAELKTISVIKL